MTSPSHYRVRVSDRGITVADRVVSTRAEADAEAAFWAPHHMARRVDKIEILALVASRPHCERPDACRAKGSGHCRACWGRAAAKRNNSDPDVSARKRGAVSAALTELHRRAPDFRRAAIAHLRRIGAMGTKARWAGPVARAALIEAQNAGKRAAKLRKSGGDHGVPV